MINRTAQRSEGSLLCRKVLRRRSGFTWELRSAVFSAAWRALAMATPMSVSKPGRLRRAGARARVRCADQREDRALRLAQVAQLPVLGESSHNHYHLQNREAGTVPAEGSDLAVQFSDRGPC
jgi:hypothetical protein